MIESLIVGTLLILSLQLVFTLAYKITSTTLKTEFEDELILCRFNQYENCDREYENKAKLLEFNSK